MARAVGALPLYLPGGLGLSDALPMAFEHHLAQEMGDGAQHRQHHTAGGSRRVQIEIGHPERSYVPFDRLDDLQKVGGRACQPVELGYDQGIALTNVVQGGITLRPVPTLDTGSVSSLTARPPPGPVPEPRTRPPPRPRGASAG